MGEILLETAKFRVERIVQELPGGGTMLREFIVHPGAVALVPLVDEQTLCLVENRRLAVDQTLLELPAGTIDAGESPRETAVRELAEETGYQAGWLAPLAEFWMSPGILSERMHVFEARQLTAGNAQLEPEEEISVRLTPLPEAYEMIERGHIQDAKTIAALLLFERRRMRAGRETTLNLSNPEIASGMDRAGQLPNPAAVRSLSMSLHNPPVLPPTAPIVPRTPIRMSANITAYSTVVAASSPLRNRWIGLMIPPPPN